MLKLGCYFPSPDKIPATRLVPLLVFNKRSCVLCMRQNTDTGKFVGKSYTQIKMLWEQCFREGAQMAIAVRG